MELVFQESASHVGDEVKRKILLIKFKAYFEELITSGVKHMNNLFKLRNQGETFDDGIRKGELN